MRFTLPSALLALILASAACSADRFQSTTTLTQAQTDAIAEAFGRLATSDLYFTNNSKILRPEDEYDVELKVHCSVGDFTAYGDGKILQFDSGGGPLSIQNQAHATSVKQCAIQAGGGDVHITELDLQWYTTSRFPPLEEKTPESVDGYVGVSGTGIKTGNCRVDLNVVVPPDTMATLEDTKVTGSVCEIAVSL